MRFLGSKNVQCVIPEEVHKALRDIAYAQHMTLRDLIRVVLINFITSQEQKAA
jgi:hypothetical protein